MIPHPTPQSRFNTIMCSVFHFSLPDTSVISSLQHKCQIKPLPLHLTLSLFLCCPLSFFSQHAGLYKRLLCELGVNWLLKSINILLATLLVKSQAGKTDECVIFLQRERKRERARERMREWWRGRKKEQGSKPRCKVIGTKGKKTELFRKKETERQSKKANREGDRQREKYCVDKKTLKGTIQRGTEKEDYVIIWEEIVPLWADR